jgi:hypothetical protein
MSLFVFGSASIIEEVLVDAQDRWSKPSAQKKESK